MSEIKPFEIKVSDDEIDDLKVRLENTRWPEQSTSSGWDQGGASGLCSGVNGLLGERL